MLIWDIQLRVVFLFYKTVPFLKFFKYYYNMQIMFKVVKSSLMKTSTRIILSSELYYRLGVASKNTFNGYII